MKTGKYPLHRFLYIYVNKRARQAARSGGARVPEAGALSKEGQEVVVKDGYLPLPAAIVTQELAKIQ